MHASIAYQKPIYLPQITTSPKNIRNGELGAIKSFNKNFKLFISATNNNVISSFSVVLLVLMSSLILLNRLKKDCCTNQIFNNKNILERTIKTNIHFWMYHTPLLPSGFTCVAHLYFQFHYSAWCSPFHYCITCTGANAAGCCIDCRKKLLCTSVRRKKVDLMIWSWVNSTMYFIGRSSNHHITKLIPFARYIKCLSTYFIFNPLHQLKTTN